MAARCFCDACSSSGLLGPEQILCRVQGWGSVKQGYIGFREMRVWVQEHRVVFAPALGNGLLVVGGCGMEARHYCSGFRV